jgi:putative pyruvate formate lyase activating enzyme
VFVTIVQVRLMSDSDVIETAALAQAHYRSCNLCEHRCGVSRFEQASGKCHASAVARVFRHRIESSEERELIPSHLFYLSGCDLRCAFCIAEANAFDASRGTVLTSTFLRQAVDWGRERGSRTLQWVGGEPTIHLPAILEAMAGVQRLPPVVWKSDFYGTPDAFDLLDGVVDTFVADFKFGNDCCATRIARVDRYLEIVTRNLRQVAERANLIVRHLLLPGHFQCCFQPIVEWLSRHLPRVKFSIRDGYLPRWRAGQFPELAERLERGTGGRAEDLADRFGLNIVV